MSGFKYKVGDRVKVVNDGKCYPTYVKFIEECTPEYKSYFYNGRSPKYGELCQIVAKDYHTRYNTESLYLIKPYFKEIVYIIGEDGIAYETIKK